MRQLAAAFLIAIASVILLFRLGKQSSLFAPERKASSAPCSLRAVESLPLEVSDVSYLESTLVKMIEQHVRNYL